MSVPHALPATAAAAHEQQAPPAAPSAGRIGSLDVLRGVAIAGILPLNAVMAFMTARILPVDAMIDSPGWQILQVFVQQHFFPLFSLLFGVTFGMILRSGLRRGDRVRGALARRSLFLVLVGIPHQILMPGELLLIYGLTGLIVLVPVTFLPARARPWIAGALGTGLLAVHVLTDDVLAIAVGMQLIGLVLGSLGLARHLETSAARRVLVRVAAVTVPISLVGAGVGLAGIEATATSWFSALTLVMIAAYASTVLVVATGRLRAAAHELFAPIGRTAMTCYVTASVVIMALVRTLPEGFDPDAPLVWVVLVVGAGALLTGQNLGARWWLARHRHGPLETLARRFTWRNRAGAPAA